MDLRLKEDWAEILRCAPRPLTALLGVYCEALSPTTATARSGLGYWIYYKYTLRLSLVDSTGTRVTNFDEVARSALKHLYIVHRL